MVWRGALGGVICGALAVVLHFAYMQTFHPHPYNVIYLFNLPVAAILGGMVGVLIAALYVSNKG